MGQGYAYIAVAQSMDGWLCFAGMKASGKQWVAQEVDKLMKMVK